MKIGYAFLALVAGTISWLLAGPAIVPALADDSDQHRVLELIREGQVLPLQELLELNREHLQGRLIDLELEREDDRWLYEIELLDDRGVVREYLIDAGTGQWLGEE